MYLTVIPNEIQLVNDPTSQAEWKKTRLQIEKLRVKTSVDVRG